MKTKQKNKQRKNDMHVKMFLVEGGNLYVRHVWKTHAVDINELQVDDC